MSEFCCSPTVQLPVQRVGPPATVLLRAVDVVARLGSLVALVALLVLAGTAGGAADGVSPDAAVSVTFDGNRP